MLSLKKKYKLNYFINLIFKEFFFKKKIKINWNQYPKRYEIINNIIKYKSYKDYLEIGCFNDENFNKIKIENKIGVDPVSGGNIRKTSDEYFKSNKNLFDIIFIDGLHHYEQVYRDVINSLNVLKKDGIILVHDCLPLKARDQMIPRSHEKWNGDVWKSIVEFRTHSNLDTYVCLADEGIGLIFKRSNRNILASNIKDFKKMNFSYFYKNYKDLLNIIDHENIYKILKN